MLSSRRRGQHYEDYALAYLERQGLKLLKRNYHCRAGEIDLIMRDGKTLVFVEVRYRKDAQFGGAAASITAQKRQRLYNTAANYLQRHPHTQACRCDALLLQGSDSNLNLQWLQHIFDS